MNLVEIITPINPHSRVSISSNALITHKFNEIRKNIETMFKIYQISGKGIIYIAQMQRFDGVIKNLCIIKLVFMKS